MTDTRADDPIEQSSSHVRRGLAFAFVMALMAVGAIATPYAKDVLPPIPGYMLAFGATMIVTNIILAGLLLSRGKADREGSSSMLGTTYLFVGLIFLPMTAAFPGSLTPGPLIGTTFSAIWIWTIWHAGFGVGMVAYSWRRSPWPHVSRAVAFVGVAALVGAVTVAATSGIDLLPRVFGDPMHGMFSGRGEAVAWSLLAIDALALVLAARRVRESEERLWLAVAMAAACFDIWLTFQSGARFSLGWYLGKIGSLSTTMVVLVSLVNNVSALYLRVRVANDALADLAMLDGLTGIANRRRFDAVLESESRRAARQSQSLALLMFDVDWFKLYNDAYGHQRGDECLKKVALVLASNARRPGDTAARYGGEEFALLLPCTDPPGALLVAERVLASIQNLALEHVGSLKGAVSISVGVACGTGNNPSALVQDADAALYAAKRAGRGCARAADAWLTAGFVAANAERLAA